MDLTHDLSDCHPLEELQDGIPTGEAPAAATRDFNSIAALAYARWEKLRGGSDLPSVPHENLSDGRFLTPNCIRIAWDEPVSTPTIAFLGGDLAAQLAGLAGRAWPNVPIESPLVELLRRISRRAINDRQAAEFDEQITDSQGWIRDCQGLALPFSGDKPGTCHVDIMFDLDDPIIGEPVLRPEPDDGVLLLEQELDPDEMPSLAQAPPPPPVLFVCVSDTGKPSHDRARQGKGAARSLMPPLVAATTRWRRPSRNPAAGHMPEPLPLIGPTQAAFEETEDRVQPVTPAAGDHLLLSLQAARKRAEAASGSEERSHLALYQALGAAHEFALLAADAPERFMEILADAALKVQVRAPMTPMVKLIFGAGYDRARLAEYARALSHALRLRLPAGSFADYLLNFEGGLKGVVKAERQLRRPSEPQGRPPSAGLEAKLRKAAVRPLDSLDPAGQEFALVMARRLPDGTVALLGEVPQDERLFRAAARRFLRR
ncbi:MAG TPA: hypothetical protein VJQ77_09575 [Novosphingobium sp.]|nr:hypothetical protein [Novosphingobium sp.]